MPLYESTFVARQDLSKQEVTKLTDQFTSIIENGGGKVVKNEYWGLRNLAYRIRKNRKGHYTMLGINAPFAAVKEMQRTMGIQEEIIRTLTVRVEELDENPSAMMNMRSGRDDESEVFAAAEPATTESKE
jgi:small subunit ribosomal protein S6